MHLVIVALQYPFPGRPAYGPFVQQFAHAVARQQGRCSVIHPVGLGHALHGTAGPGKLVEEAGPNARVTVYRPRFFSCSSRQLGPWNTFCITCADFHRAARRTARTELSERPDAFYGHFLYPAAASAVKIGQELGIPAFAGLGEHMSELDGTLWTLRYGSMQRHRRLFAKANGFIPNSSALARQLRLQLDVPEDRVAVFPNGISKSLFRPADKLKMRRTLELPEDRFLVTAVGSITERKGQRRVLEAIRDLPQVAAVLLGGKLPDHDCRHVAFADTVAHDQVPLYLAACDLFVLPSLAEGCNNATIEAMACGLPVVGSEDSFNDDILNPDVAIRVNPRKVQEIRDAIVALRDDPDRRATMSAAALHWSRQFDVDQRARRILEWMRHRMARNTEPPSRQAAP